MQHILNEKGGFVTSTIIEIDILCTNPKKIQGQISGVRGLRIQTEHSSSEE